MRRGYGRKTYFGDYGNKNAITDLGVSSLLLATALEGAILNVKINLPGISDDEYVKTTTDKCADMLKKGLEIKGRIMDKVNSNL